MQATTGDRLIIKGHRVGEHDRDGLIMEVLGDDGSPPYVVKWDDDGHTGLVYPGPDSFVEHFTPEKKPSKTHSA
jgi:hypothetical protein